MIAAICIYANHCVTVIVEEFTAVIEHQLDCFWFAMYSFRENTPFISLPMHRRDCVRHTRSVTGRNFGMTGKCLSGCTSHMEVFRGSY
jgi:hypothetical protein